MPAEKLPSISLVTPVRNSVRYLEAALTSVLLQGYPSLEYIVVDGGSDDGSLEVIRRHEKQLSSWVSEPDRGMYDAINKGFARSSGEVMGWISGTDLLHRGSLRAVAEIFAAFPEVEWITGRPTLFDAEGTPCMIGPVPRWSRWRFLVGANRYIQQESTFWRRSLWERAGGHVDATCRNGADFELWLRFFRHARPIGVSTILGGYRVHDDALGHVEANALHAYHDAVIERELTGLGRRGRLVSSFRRWDRRVREAPRIGDFWRRRLRSLLRLPGPDLPPVVVYRIRLRRWELRSGWRSRIPKWGAPEI